jgi:hypothetical protein
MPESNAVDSGDEDLFALEDHPGAGPRVLKKTFHFIRHVPREETEQNQSAARLLSQMTLRSGLADLRYAEEILHEEIARIEADGTNPSTQPRRGARLQREFKAWLSAFRAFDDRTSAWLSDQFGKDHPAYTSFKQSLSHEFDRNFGYRLCCALRNVSEHQADVINDMHFHRHQNPDSGAPETSVTVRFDGPRLAESFPRIRPATRDELRRCERPLELVWIVKAVGMSCERIHAGLFIALWPEIQSSIETIGRAHEEAIEAGGDWAAFLGRDMYTGLGEGPSDLSMRWNAYELADLAIRNHAETSAIVQGAPWILLAQQFMD